ncbi:hypothetical protein HZA56_17580 [Candidatus Poribacteria bacterium]|nr:hypothetical protein [Candidatus Poribacteria bacterium]
MDEMLKEFATNVMGMTEEDLAKISPEMGEGLKNAMLNIGRYRIVAEVISSQYCFAGLQPGQKYILQNGPQLNTAESTAPVCVGALPPLAERANLLLDRVYNNVNVTAPMAGFRCHDPGINLGGLGHVQFKVTVEEIA